MKNKNGVMLLTVVLLCASLFGVSVESRNNDAGNEKIVCLNNVGVTSCWLGTCGHPAIEYSFGYRLRSVATNYFYTGYFLEPGVTHEISYEQQVSQSMNVGGVLDAQVAKASLGFSGEYSKKFEVKQRITNTSNSRKYAHIGIEFEIKGVQVAEKVRTYYPGEHILAYNDTCAYSVSYKYPSCKMATGCGLVLRDSR